MVIETDTRSSRRNMSSYFKALNSIWRCRQLEKFKEIQTKTVTAQVPLFNYIN